MTPIGTVLVAVLGLVLLSWILNLMRLGRLYVAYGLVFLVLIVGTLSTLAIPALGVRTEALLETLFPGTGPLVVGFTLIVLLLVYILAQMTMLSNRFAALVQELAVRRAGPVGRESEARSSPPGTS